MTFQMLTMDIKIQHFCSLHRKDHDSSFSDAKSNALTNHLNMIVNI